MESVANIGIDVDPKVLITDESGNITLPQLLLSVIFLNEETNTAVNDVRSDDKLNVYPNPSLNGIFYLKSFEAWGVYSTTGQKILSGESYQVNLSGLKKGLYFLRTSSGIDKLLSK